MNSRVEHEARAVIQIPLSAITWDIIDIGEGERTDNQQNDAYLQEIFQEIVERVDRLLGSTI